LAVMDAETGITTKLQAINAKQHAQKGM
jgi:hypothetical protein